MVNHGQSWSIMVNHGQKTWSKNMVKKHGQKTWSKQQIGDHVGERGKLHTAAMAHLYRLKRTSIVLNRLSQPYTKISLNYI